MDFKKEELIKSPLNYTGGKFKLLPQLLKYFPNEINMFVDLFGGGNNVGINVNANKIIYNEICEQLVYLMKEMFNKSLEEQLIEIDLLIEKYKLSKENKEGFLKLREHYNNNEFNSMEFYTLICYAFNNQIRFNKNGKYNMPFGKDRSSFNETLRKKYVNFVKKMKEKNFIFTNNDFRELKIDKLNKNDLVYCDPPYYNSIASYNENGGWSEKEEKSLLELLDKLNDNNIKFALSNNLKYENPLLYKWKNKYNVHYLDINYSNCNYQKKNKSKDKEILITNY